MAPKNGPNLGLYYGWAYGDDHWNSPGVDDDLLKIDTLLQGAAKSFTVFAPPSGPAEGDVYVVAQGGSGAWSGRDRDVALFISGNWIFYAPKPGCRLWDVSTGVFRCFTNAATWAAEITVVTGPQGATGATGATGQSAYQVAQANGFSGTQSQWIASLVGPKGSKGDKGDPGVAGLGLNNRGQWSSGSTYNPNDFVFDLESDGTTSAIWIWQGAAGTTVTTHPRSDLTDWIMLTAPQGLKGDQGEIGPTGAAGMSAYQVWLASGNSGTVETFLGALVGPRGEPGSNGLNGTNGYNGTDGLSAYQIWLDLGHTGTQADFMAALKGVQGEQGLQGPQGVQGPQGPQGTITSATYDGASSSWTFDFDLHVDRNFDVGGTATLNHGLIVNTATLTANSGATINNGLAVDALGVSGNSTFTGMTTFNNVLTARNIDGNISGGATGNIIVDTKTATGDAVIAFNVSGLVATNIGMCHDGYFRIGGWSWPRDTWTLGYPGNTAQGGSITANGATINNAMLNANAGLTVNNVPLNANAGATINGNLVANLGATINNGLTADTASFSELTVSDVASARAMSTQQLFFADYIGYGIQYGVSGWMHTVVGTQGFLIHPDASGRFSVLSGQEIAGSIGQAATPVTVMQMNADLTMTVNYGLTTAALTANGMTTFNNVLTARNIDGNISGGGTGNIIVDTKTATGDAVIALNVSGVIATNIGMCHDGYFRIGGWSWGRDTWRLDGLGNTVQPGSVTANNSIIGANLAISGNLNGAMPPTTNPAIMGWNFRTGHGEFDFFSNYGANLVAGVSAFAWFQLNAAGTAYAQLLDLDKTGVLTIFNGAKVNGAKLQANQGLDVNNVPLNANAGATINGSFVANVGATINNGLHADVAQISNSLSVGVTATMNNLAVQRIFMTDYFGYDVQYGVSGWIHSISGTQGFLIRPGTSGRFSVLSAPEISSSAGQATVPVTVMQMNADLTMTANYGLTTPALNTSGGISTFNGSVTVNSNNGNQAGGATGNIIINSQPSGGNPTDAVIAMNVQGVIATNIGMCHDGYFRVGGWSWGRDTWRLDGLGNTVQPGSVTAVGATFNSASVNANFGLVVNNVVMTVNSGAIVNNGLTADTLHATANTTIDGTLNLGSQLGARINLYSTNFGLGINSNETTVFSPGGGSQFGVREGGNAGTLVLKVKSSGSLLVSDFQVSGAGTYTNGLTVNGAQTALNQGLVVNNALATANAGLTVNNAALTANDGLTVNQAATFNGTTTFSGPLNGKIYIQSGGNQTFSGSQYGYLIPTGAGLSSFSGTASDCCLQANGRIVANELDAISDARLKDAIKPIAPEDGLKFVTHAEPCTYMMRDDRLKQTHSGYVAQDLAKACGQQFEHVISMNAHAGLAESVDDDGWYSPEGFALSVNYLEIVPYLHAWAKGAQSEINSLREQVNYLRRRLFPEG